MAIAMAIVLGAVSSAAPGEPPAAPAAPAPSAAAGKLPAPSMVIVFCAPGYPGNTVQAQPAMDAFARAVEKAAGWPTGKLGAVYHESEGGGIEALRKPEAVLSVTTLPFYIQDGEKAGLKPRLMAERNGSPAQQWSLVAKKDRIGSAADLEGWELASPAGYAPDFVRTLFPLPASTKITFSPAPLGVLRRVVAGENVAVLLEPEQVQALFPKHPFAKDLVILGASKPVPGSIVSSVGDRLKEADSAKLLDALTRLKSTPDGADALKTLRIEGFAVLAPRLAEALRRTPCANCGK
jgi:hypothetical protein